MTPLTHALHGYILVLITLINFLVHLSSSSFLLSSSFADKFVVKAGVGVGSFGVSCLLPSILFFVGACISPELFPRIFSSGDWQVSGVNWRLWSCEEALRMKHKQGMRTLLYDLTLIQRVALILKRISILYILHLAVS